ncbi:MAG TPA: hypothetical protein VFU47_07000 [Armatimonadota bacterium]|nr:hypothetical protein [Armatimonadota bacterium]
MMRAISVTICRDRRPDSPVAPRTPLPDDEVRHLITAVRPTQPA